MNDPAIVRFAERLQAEVGAERVLLFGSRARGAERNDSDYDVIVVAPRFADIALRQRARGLRQLWYDVGGEGPLDLMCLTPKEFALAQGRVTLIAAVTPAAIDLLPAPALVT